MEKTFDRCPACGHAIYGYWTRCPYCRRLRGGVAETVDPIGEAARGRGWRIETTSRSDRQVVLGLTEPDTRKRHRLRVKADKSGQVTVDRRTGRLSAAILLVTSAVLSVGGSYAWIDVSTIPCDGFECMGKGILLGFAVVCMVTGIVIMLALAWKWRPSRRRVARELDRMISQTVTGPNRVASGDAASEGEDNSAVDQR